MKLGDAKRHILKIKKETADLDFLLWRREAGDYEGEESLAALEDAMADTVSCIKIHCEFLLNKIRDR